MPKVKPGAFHQYVRFDETGTRVIATYEIGLGGVLPYKNMVNFADLGPVDVAKPEVLAVLKQRWAIVKAATDAGVKDPVVPDPNVSVVDGATDVKP